MCVRLRVFCDSPFKIKRTPHLYCVVPLLGGAAGGGVAAAGAVLAPGAGLALAEEKKIASFARD